MRNLKILFIEIILLISSLVSPYIVFAAPTPTPLKASPTPTSKPTPTPTKSPTPTPTKAPIATPIPTIVKSPINNKPTPPPTVIQQVANTVTQIIIKVKKFFVPPKLPVKKPAEIRRKPKTKISTQKKRSKTAIPTPKKIQRPVLLNN